MDIKEKILRRIFDKNPAQKKKIEKLFQGNRALTEDFDRFLATYGTFMEREGIEPEELVDSYLQFVDNVMESRFEFMRSGQYPVSSQAEVVKNVYGNKKVMKGYLLGIALSQFLWGHHYKMFTFYRDEICHARHGRNFLEIGSGHGLLMMELLDVAKAFDTIDIVDISETSLEITKGIISALKPDLGQRINFMNQDVQDLIPAHKYDFITMGEVLEHVDCPLEILKILRSLLADGGNLFITTCANCPLIDHVYHFHTIDEIRAMIQKAGFAVVKELVVPSEDKSPELIEKYKLDISYAAILKLADGI